MLPVSSGDPADAHGADFAAVTINVMDRKDQYNPKNDRAAQDALRDEANKPDPLYDKTNRNFQRHHQGPQQGSTSDPEISDQHKEGSSSGEEKDII